MDYVKRARVQLSAPVDSHSLVDTHHREAQCIKLVIRCQLARL